MSYVELVVPKDESGEGGGGLGMLRAFRLLRIFKIIKSWESLKVLLGAVLGSLGDITNLGILIFSKKASINKDTIQFLTNCFI